MIRGALIAMLALGAMLLASPSHASDFSKGLVVGKTLATPHIVYSPPTLAAPVASGTAMGTASINGLSGGSWSMNPTTNFQVNGSTGAVTASTTVNAGAYTPTLSYTGTALGETITVALVTSIVVSGVGCPTGTLNLSCAANSAFLGVIR